MLVSWASLLRNLVLLAALGSLAAAAAPVAWHLGGWSTALPERPAPISAPVAESAPVDLDPILNLAPFGAVEEAPEPEAPIGETTLDLVLRGVVVQDDPEASTAFILHDGRTHGYRPGDAVAERARLVEVAPGQAVLEVDGQFQTLSFPRPDPDGAASSAAEISANASGPEQLRQMATSEPGGEDDDDEENFGEFGDTIAPEASSDDGPQTVEEHIDLWRERIRANPQQVLDTIGLIPVENGYRIAEQHDSGVGLAGLQAGDVVTSVNGQAVGDVERDRQLFDEVAASGLARVEVQRDGRALVLTFPLQ